MQAKKTNKVGRVGMEELAGGRRVDANLVDLGGVIANVLDMAENVALSILAEGVAEDGADAQVDGRRFFHSPLDDGETLDYGNTAAVDELVAKAVKERVRFGTKLPSVLPCQLLFARSLQRTHLVDGSQWLAGSLKSRVCGLKLSNELRSPAVEPKRFIVLELLLGPDGAAIDLLRKLGVGNNKVKVGLDLARGEAKIIDSLRGLGEGHGHLVVLECKCSLDEFGSRAPQRML